jgi:hypothetical protein
MQMFGRNIIRFLLYVLQFVASLTHDRIFYCYKQLELLVFAALTIHKYCTKRKTSL